MDIVDSGATQSLEIKKEITKEELEEFFCPVCHELYEKVVREPWTTPCEHEFCKSCLEKWLSSKSSCPICRSSLSLADCRKQSKSCLQRLWDSIQLNASRIYSVFCPTLE